MYKKAQFRKSLSVKCVADTSCVLPGERLSLGELGGQGQIGRMKGQGPLGWLLTRVAREEGIGLEKGEY